MAMDLVFFARPSSVHTVRWIDGLRARGHRVELVPNDEDGARGALKVRRALRHLLRVRRAAGRPGAILVVMFLPAGGRAVALLGLHPRIAIAGGSDIYLSSGGSWRWRLRATQQAWFLHGCDAVVATSRDLQRAAVAAGARRELASCVPFGVGLDRFRPGPPSAELARSLDLEGRRVLLSSRAIAPIYNQATVVEALTGLPQEVVVVMTEQGAVAPERERIRRLARAHGVSERVRIIPPVPEEEMARLYDLAEVVLSVPSSDGSASTIQEALACGRPIVATDLPSAREWLGALDPQSLVAVGDPAGTAAAIRRILDLPPA